MAPIPKSSPARRSWANVAARGDKGAVSSPTGGAPPAPPGLSLQEPSDIPPRVETEPVAAAVPLPEDFVQSLRQRPLPTAFAPGGPVLARFTTAILSCVEGLYRDRIKPTLGEVQARLRSSGWGFSEVQAILPICARDLETYELEPPKYGQPPLVLLRQPPQWFCGFVEAETTDAYSKDLWTEMRNIVRELDSKKPASRFLGGLNQLAASLHKKKLGPKLASLSLGELRSVMQLAAGPQHRLLAYDALHGGRLVSATSIGVDTPPSKPELPAAEATPPRDRKGATANAFENVTPPTRDPPASGARVPSWQRASAEAFQNEAKTKFQPPGLHSRTAKVVEQVPPSPLLLPDEAILANLKLQPLPEGLGQGGQDPETRRRCRALRSCVDSLYRDRIEPTDRKSVV